MPRVINLPADLASTETEVSDNTEIFRSELLSTLEEINKSLRTIINHQRLITDMETDENMEEF